MAHGLLEAHGHLSRLSLDQAATIKTLSEEVRDLKAKGEGLHARCQALMEASDNPNIIRQTAHRTVLWPGSARFEAEDGHNAIDTMAEQIAYYKALLKTIWPDRKPVCDACNETQGWCCDEQSVCKNCSDWGRDCVRHWCATVEMDPRTGRPYETRYCDSPYCLGVHLYQYDAQDMIVTRGWLDQPNTFEVSTSESPIVSLLT